MINFTSPFRKCKYFGWTLYFLLSMLIAHNTICAQQSLSIGQNGPYALHNPSYQSRNGNYVELLGVERWTNATIMNLKFFWNGKTTGLSVNNKFYLVDKANGRKYQARYVMNVTYNPHITFINNVWEHVLYFQIVFPSLPNGVQSLDLRWDVPSYGFDFYGINVEVLFSKPAPSSCSLPQTGYELPRLRRTASTVKVPMNRYNTNYQFHDGMLSIYDKNLHGYGFINEKGEKCTTFEWYYPTLRLGHEPAFGGGYCLVCKRKEHTEYWYIIDKKGNITANLGSHVTHVHPFNKDGYANIVVSEGGEQKAMLIDGLGREVFPHLSQKPVYASQYPYILDPFYEDLAAFKDGKGNWGVINRAGKIVIQPKYEHVDRFSEGVAAVHFKATDTQSSLWGYIDRSGNVVIPPTFRIQPGRFSEQIAIVTKHNGKQVAMDIKGQIISKEWDEITPFKYGRAIANKKYVIDYDMNIVNGPFIKSGSSVGLTIYPDFYRQNMYKCQFGLHVFPSGFFYHIDNVEVVSDKLLHFKNSNTDAFIDAGGNIVFEFVENEF